MGSERASVVEGGEPAASAAAGVNVWGERCAQWCPMVLNVVGHHEHGHTDDPGGVWYWY